jgi:hypothetical protein
VASRSVAGPRSATATAPSTNPSSAPSRARAARARRPNPRPGGTLSQHALAFSASKATWEGCFGARNSSGAASNRAAIPAGKYARNYVAASVSAIRVISVRT